MKIVITGGGKVGEKLCVDLSSEGHDIVLIEQNSRRLAELIDMADITGIVGNGAMLSSQQEAGMENCDVFVAATPDDENNIIAAVTAKKLGAKYSIVRVRDPGYYSQEGFLKLAFGFDFIINPELEAAKEIITMIQFPAADDIDKMAQGRAMMIGIRLDAKSPLVGVMMQNLKSIGVDALACLIIRGEDYIIPSGKITLEAGDYAYFTGKMAELHNVFKLGGKLKTEIKSVLITGGSKIAEYLIPKLLELKKRVKVIERNKERADYLSTLFPKAEVIMGDGTNQSFLKSQRMNEFDAVIALTNIDEENILLSLFAHQSGIKKTITKINRSDLLKIVPLGGLDSIVRPRYMIADSIVRRVRSMTNTEGSDITSLYRPADGKVEAIQFLVAKGSRVIGRTLADLPIRSDVLLGIIIRKDKVIYPRGSDIIMEGDYVTVMTTSHNLRDINDIIEEEL